MENYLLGCDWGTSSFRLGLYNLMDSSLIDEIQSADGVSGIHSKWQNENYEAKGISKNTLFLEKLLAQVKLLSKKTALNLDKTPVLISGMASSSIGIEDVPYASLPFALDGSGAMSMKFNAKDDFPHPVILISGVCSEHDVMRGEETQLIGIWSLLKDSGLEPNDAIVILPGTHSKHAYISNGQLINFKTFMTGEMYQLTGNYSILKDSVKMTDKFDLSVADTQAFKMGVKKSGESGILNALFTVRTNQLFSSLHKTQNAFYLSGLLIGSELNDLINKQGSPLILCSGKKLSGLYTFALEELGLAARTTFIPAGLVEKAAITGQRIIYEQYANNKLLNE